MAKKKVKQEFPDVLYGSYTSPNSLWTEETLEDTLKNVYNEKNGMVRIGIYKLDKVIRGKCGFTEC